MYEVNLKHQEEDRSVWWRHPKGFSLKSLYHMFVETLNSGAEVADNLFQIGQIVETKSAK